VPRGLRGHDRFDVAAIVLLLALAILVIFTYDSYAISNDEGVQQHYGELILRYYESGFTDRALFSFDNLYLYGGLFDIVATLIAKILPFELYSIRHILCALIGIGGIAATWATGRMIAGPRAGLIAALALTLCGPWYGGMFNHTKDVTFAAAMIGGFYMLLRVIRALPVPRRRDVLYLGMLMGAALGLRALGLFLPVYVALAIVMEVAIRHDMMANRDRLIFIGRALIVLFPAFVVGYLIMIASWPWAALEFLNPARAILTFSHFHYPIHTILDGQTYDMAHVPPWYVPAYLLIKLPLVMHCGAALALIAAAAPRLQGGVLTRRSRFTIGLLAVTVGLPILCHALSHGPAFSGLRHFLFVVPALAVLTGIGFEVAITWLWDWRPAVAVGAGAALAAAMTWNAIVLVRLHPYEYLFFNPIVGGLKGAAGRYVTDYWVNVMPEAVHRLDAFLALTESGGGRTAPAHLVAVCAERVQFEGATDRRLRWTDDWDRADFFIAPTHMNCDRMLDGKVIARIERSGVVIGVVKDRRALVRHDVASTSSKAAVPPQ
jgi:hypothetical protein